MQTNTIVKWKSLIIRREFHLRRVEKFTAGLAAFIARHRNNRCIIGCKRVTVTLNSLKLHSPFIAAAVVFNRGTTRIWIRLARHAENVFRFELKSRRLSNRVCTSVAWINWRDSQISFSFCTRPLLPASLPRYNYQLSNNRETRDLTVASYRQLPIMNG